MSSARVDHLGALSPAQTTRLVGHENAAAFLGDAYRSGRVHHAVLIEGPEGIGKATLAFRFAHHILAHPDPASAPRAIADPTADSIPFRQVASGASHHLLHLTRPRDEKTGRIRSAITVDEVRRAGKLFGQTAGTGGWRIVIVDPADDLNRSAANALLKMLEEPPRRSLFLVVSHAPGRLLATIRSRCLALRLTPLQPADLDHVLADLQPSQNLDAESRGRIASLAGGSVSRALTMIDAGGLEIVDTVETIMREGPQASRGRVHALADRLTGRDSEQTYGFFLEVASDWTTRRAREAASAGDLPGAASHADLAMRLKEDIAVADAYNLDRKQVVLSIFSSLFGVTRP